MHTTMKKSSGAKSRAGSRTNQGKPIELPEGTWERIKVKAHELWEARGCREGHDLRDWLDAEEIVMEEIHEARE